MEKKKHELSKLSILIAEDDGEVAESLKNILSEKGIEVTLAHDGEEAISKLGEKNFDVVILDLKLPKVSGFEILGFIKTNFPPQRLSSLPLMQISRTPKFVRTSVLHM
jgi:DNA-binding response OmpR family regulator